MSQISKKFIENNAVDGTKIRLLNEQTLRARNSANTADIDILKVNASDQRTLMGDLYFGNFQGKNAADPTAAQDVATKAYVDAVAVGIDWKPSCRVATDAALPASSYSNGASGVGATLTATVNGPIGLIDGVSLVLNDRVLVKDQASGLQNGIYYLSQVGIAGGGGSPWILTRATDSDTDAEVTPGLASFMEEGTVSADGGFVLVTDAPIIIGTTALSFIQFSGAGQIIAGMGIAKSGNTLSTDNGDGLVYVGNKNTVKIPAFSSAATIGFDGGFAVKGLSAGLESFTLNGTDITNGYVDLAEVAHTLSIRFNVIGGPTQVETQDYTVNYTGGGGGNTRITFAGDLAVGGNAALVSGDILKIYYQYL